MSGKTKDALSDMESEINALLDKLGVDHISVTTSASKSGGGQKPKKKAQGGMLGGLAHGSIVPGVVGGDRHPLHLNGKHIADVESGESIVVGNKKATARALAENARVKRYAQGGIIEQALGPYDAPPISYDPNHAGGNSHLHLDFFTVAQALGFGHKLQGMGWTIGEYTPSPSNPFNFGGISVQHQSPGHYDGTAFDANSGDESKSAIMQIASMLGGAAGGAAMMAMVPKLKERLMKGPKGMIAVGQGILDKGRNAGNAYLAKHAPTAGVGGGVAGYSGAGNYTASWYGPTPSTTGASGQDLRGTMSFAELSKNPNGIGSDFSALGGLPMHTKIGVTYGGKTLTLEKLDDRSRRSRARRQAPRNRHLGGRSQALPRLHGSGSRQCPDRTSRRWQGWSQPPPRDRPGRRDSLRRLARQRHRLHRQEPADDRRR